MESRLVRSTTITCKTSFEGIHRFPDAPPEVGYLRNPHRHVFYVEVEMDVYHTDREVEFISAKHAIDAFLRTHFDMNGVWQMDTLSCEQVAELIMDFLEERYCRVKQRAIIVTVSEDNENGATVYGVRGEQYELQ